MPQSVKADNLRFSEDFSCSLTFISFFFSMFAKSLQTDAERIVIVAMAIQTINLEKFTNDEHYTVVELVIHTVKAAGIVNRKASQRLEALREAYRQEGDFFKLLHKHFGNSDLKEIDRQLCDKSERTRQMQELFRLCSDQALLDAVDESRQVRSVTDQAYLQLIEMLNALLVVSPNEELSKVETQLNQQASYIDYRYHHADRENSDNGNGNDNSFEAEVRLMTLPFTKSS